jgi:magnesium and cobalt exporter, CNNM family
MTTILLTLLLILATIYGGLISAWETALFSLSSMQIKTYNRDPDPRKQLIARLISKPRELIVTLLILNTLANLIVQNAAANIFGEYSGWGLKVGVPIVVTLLFSEIIPKALGFANNTRISYQGASHISKIQRWIGPISKFLTRITNYVSRAMFFFLKREQEISKEELHHVLKTSQEHGILATEEAELIDGYLTLQETTVKELMRPREDILYYNLNDPLSKLTHLFVEEACTRIPVCEGEFEKILGVITAPTFFVHRSDIHSPQDLLSFLDKPFFVPETTPARVLLKQFSIRHENFALVVDEYGSLPGLITREDLFETVVGEIADRRDQKNLYTRSGKNVIIASGKLELAEFENIFGVSLKSPNNMLTIGGWLTERLGDIPKSGTQYTSEGFLFHVLAADPNRVKRIYIRKLAAGPNLSKPKPGKKNG